MVIENRATHTLIPYSQNAKVHDERQITNVANSIKRYGWQQPIVIDDSGVVIIGHCRLLAAKRLGLAEVPVTVASGLTEQEIRELRIADNKTNESPWDFDLLEKDRAGLAFEGFDFDWMEDGEQCEEMPEPEVEEDNFDDDDIPNESDIKPGDVFVLGRHRIMCGDSTSIGDVEKLMDGAKADLFLTDPPYNIDYREKQEKLLQFRANKRVEKGEAIDIENDAMDDGTFREFLLQAFGNADIVMRPGGAFYIWHADLYGHIFRQAVIDAGWNLKQVLIWVKNNITIGRQDYHYRHEPCLYGWKKGGAHYFIDSRKEQTVFDDKIDVKKLKKEEMRALLERILADKTPTTVLYEDKPLINDIHPTMKPVKLMARLIRNSTRPGGRVLDLFGGSGSTMMACEQLDRTCYTMELDPRYVEAMIRRYVKFTGNDDVYLIQGGQRIPYAVDA